jgi:hypothetical protein
MYLALLMLFAAAVPAALLWGLMFLCAWICLCELRRRETSKALKPKRA